MLTDLRRILEQVASGDLSPDDALELLPKRTQSRTVLVASARVVAKPPGRIHLLGSFRRVFAGSDPTVVEPVLEGTGWTLTREGDDLLVTSDDHVPGTSPVAIESGRFRERKAAGHRGHYTAQTGPVVLRMRVNPRTKVVCRDAVVQRFVGRNLGGLDGRMFGSFSGD